MTRILVYRFSAMGDVVMLLPVLKGLLASNQQVEIYLCTPAFLFPVFRGIERLHLIGADFKEKHKGTAGLFRLFKQLKSEVNPDLVIDLHQVIRTYALNACFRVAGYRVIGFNKGRKEKKLAIKTKSREPLPSTFERYATAFEKAGFRFSLSVPPLFPKTAREEALTLLGLDPLVAHTLIGIAPFAKHQQKVWGKDKTEMLIAELTKNNAHTVVLFGGGKSELEILDQLAAKYPNCLVAAHYLKFNQEIQVLPHLELMVSMDSANMHLASMAGVPTISIWGATHPSLGFVPYHQPEENRIQYEGNDLACRPCSVFGNKKCIYESVRCMDYISVDRVLARVNQLLTKSEKK
ncbi:glycosyltransferase family 9 protein [Gaoshiqia sp. Z1-71]|uniref:glycosyltransferase family 9 protein n=1 Tax=Gaoshiqia hydrogeniformans TaxID=3290090 RepID=UPI003BF8E196